MADAKSFWTGMIVGGTLGFFIFSATGRSAVGAATRVGAAKAKKRLKKWEKKHA